MPLDVVCPGCGGRFHETFDEDGYVEPLKGMGKVKNPRQTKYSPLTPNGSMMTLKEPFRSWGWATFPQDPWYAGDALQCPECETPYADVSGRIRTEEQLPMPLIQTQAEVAEAYAPEDDEWTDLLASDSLPEVPLEKSPLMEDLFEGLPRLSTSSPPVKKGRPRKAR
jgi:hypothetical protein